MLRFLIVLTLLLSSCSSDVADIQAPYPITYTVQASGDAVVVSIKYYGSDGQLVTVASPVLPWTTSIQTALGRMAGVVAEGQMQNGTLSASMANTLNGTDPNNESDSCSIAGAPSLANCTVTIGKILK